MNSTQSNVTFSRNSIVLSNNPVKHKLGHGLANFI